MLSSLLNGIIRLALQNRLTVVAVSLLILVYGGWQMTRLPIDVFPDLNRPRVVIVTEAHGLAPEEVETLITFPIETALNGAAGVQAVRTSSAAGISIVNVEFEWGTDIYTDRQVVTERLALAAEQLPAGVKPQLAPISSIMGQILMAAVYSQPSDSTLLFEFNTAQRTIPAISASFSAGGGESGRRAGRRWHIDESWLTEFGRHGFPISNDAKIEVEIPNSRWVVHDPALDQWFTVVGADDRWQVHRRTSPMQMRTMADWVVRQKLLAINGVSQVFVMGGQRKQFQVLVDPNRMLKYGVTLHEIETAVAKSNENTTGGYLDEQGPHEFLVRVLGRVQTVAELRDIVVKQQEGQSILLGQVAEVDEGPQIKRGDSAAYVKPGDERAASIHRSASNSPSGFSGGPAVVLTISKQPGADTREVTDFVAEALAELQDQLPDDLQIQSQLYSQKLFIDRAIENVQEALRDGAILVVLILFVFLLNFRTTFITLTAIPLSIVVTALVFKWFGLSINTMTLGGLAVAIGELVDDAIVGVENVYRRLRENRYAANPKPTLLVVFQASSEVRNPIVFGTLIVVLVFIPLFALSGMEGKLFTPLGIAYIVSILSSLVVSLTVTPVLSYWMLRNSGEPAASDATAAADHGARDPIFLRFLKWLAGLAIRFSLRLPAPILAGAALVVGIAAVAALNLERDFLPPFDEGAVQINVMLPAGTSLEKSDQVAAIVDRQLLEIPAITTLVRRTGRAELDEHAQSVNSSEIVATIDPQSPLSREALLQEIRDKLAEVPGIVISVEQPLAHLISHMLSGVKAQVAIKVYGDDLTTLRQQADQIKAAMGSVPGVKDLQVEQQVMIPQLRIALDGSRLKQYGLTRGDVTEFVETAMNGRVVSEVLEGQRKFDLLVRLAEPFREDLQTIRRLSINLPAGGSTKLENVARIYRDAGPNTINREQVRRRVVVQCNVGDRGLVDVVEDIKQLLAPIEADMPSGYFVEYGGQFESQQSASRMISILFVISLAGILLILFSMFGSLNLALQVMVALPMAFIGSVAALYVTGQTLTVAAMVGFISLCGIASRNGILLINHYLHLVKYEDESWNRQMIVRAGQERLAPVLMTALTSGIGLIPLALAAGEPGKEILYPVATVIIGGLLTCTLLEFLVRPALFWTFGTGSARRVCQRFADQIELIAYHKESGSQGASPETATQAGGNRD